MLFWIQVLATASLIGAPLFFWAMMSEGPRRLRQVATIVSLLALLTAFVAALKIVWSIRAPY